ncbi:ATP-binding cassette domain-containing protein [Veronia pacifica]|uniref:Zinc ABC transporter ATP-binding protein ZnuC n=2 Tax=Veronia pacifica TaxID=1080227 RepID=A0A1C3E6T0_9GAMM|nr:zinc ABC transporter ATP-binding protein ZnuC [Veronia pacifica]
MLISTEALSVSIGKRRILDNICMSVERGEILTIIGPNGSGKSTLLRTLIGAVPATSGTVNKVANLRIGYVPQTLHIDETLPMTVRRFMSLPNTFSKKHIDTALEQAGVLGLDNQQVMSLSGGQFQRVLLARALLGNPDILLLDEATQGLDHRGSIGFYRQIEAVRRELNCAVIMVSHELHVVMRTTDRVICLNGHICCQGKPEVVSATPEYLALFGFENESETALYLHKDHHDFSHSNCELQTKDVRNV